MNKKQVIISSFLSVITPGLGFMYIGRKDLFYLVILSSLLFDIITQFVMPFKVLYYVYNLTLDIIYLFIIIFTVIYSIKYNKFYYSYKNIILYIIIFIIYITIHSAINISERVLDIYDYQLSSGEGNSMYPFFYGSNIYGFNDIFIVRKKPLSANSLKRGDIVCVSCKELNKDIMKRIVGLPNEKIEIKSANIFINDKRIKYNWIYFSDLDLATIRHPKKVIKTEFYEYSQDSSHLVKTYIPTYVTKDGYLPPLTIYPIKIPKESFFLLGDNILHSDDSRKYGTFHLSEIKYKFEYFKSYKMQMIFEFLNLV